jgi:hypothetical protein
MDRDVLANLPIILAGAFALTIIVTAYIAGLPDSNCVAGPVSELWSGDHLFKATILRKTCLHGEAFTYSVRIDKPNTPTRGWFFTLGIEKMTTSSRHPTTDPARARRSSEPEAAPQRVLPDIVELQRQFRVRRHNIETMISTGH